ncbi:MAG: beta-ketoacyl-[acyl-carrier-protein] synthase II [Chloroflexi bacterium CG07_land_8_20_14_0_80_45_17]|nr:MAG: beta-ketoacyl-[acyl-carrier-protein] synthase II [Chloroflexi bacterium CG23_combo_of_CG06-09_8_20_14_all_45_10]PIU56156.1 MAG: beta-ketoacyl-[acyl-carrier-protein] synthase II [Chloroflexi bacterium CG07_land_8_20_14_0_80_45_17]
MNKRRVAVTGIGAVTPLATGAEQSWQALCQGKSGVARITKFDPSGFKTQIAAEVRDFHPEDFMDKKRVRRTDPFIHYALVATRMALGDSGLIINHNNANRVGIVVGTCVGGMSTYEKNLRTLQEEGPDKVSPFFIPGFIPNMAVGEIAIVFGAKGPSKCVVTACATGSHAIGDAFRLIQYGEADAMIAGGSDAYILPVGIAGLGKMGAISRRNDEPEKASRPFDKDRDGFVLGEGAGIIILEEMESAIKRGGKIYAELVGYGSTVDGYHITEPDWQNQARCIRLALDEAAISPGDIDYINAHGTATVLNDISETKAIKAALGERSRKVPVSSNKSMTGHLLAAAGAVEAIFTILTIRDGIIPPTINYETPDPECDLDYVPNVARKAEVNIALSNSFGFGGANAALVFKKFSG